MRNQILTSLATLLLLSSSGYQGVQAKTLYDHAKSDVAIYTKLNFEKQVSKNRDKGISIVHYYKSEKESEALKYNYESFATENKGIFRIGSVDCEDQPQICEKEGVTKFPTIKIYPEFPVPALDLEQITPFDSINLKKAAGRFYQDKSIEITSKNHKTFITEDISTPKVLLFTNAKQGTPFVYKALSYNFQKTLQFGLIRESENALAQEYKVKSFPALFVVKSEGKPIKYEGKDFQYQTIFEFLNVHSQIFVDPNAKDNQPKQSAASKPWLTVPVAEMTKESGNDICLKKDGSLCVIIMVKDKSQISQQQLDLLNSVGQGFASKISRGITFYFSWLNASANKDFFSVFQLQEEELPKVIVLNPGKRKRFLVHEDIISESAIEATLEKILGGDARFKNIKDNTLPELVSSYEQEEQQEAKKEDL